MLNFPSLSRSVSLENFTEGLASDPSIRSESEAGYVISRARYTRMPKMFGFTYRYLTAADKAALEEFQNTVKVGADAFNWSHPKESIVFTVRLKEPLDFQLEDRNPDYWKVSIRLDEA